ncbi:hypothetical protein [Ancylobacter lacus]|uniref:hypothetical protein n=1 Tax=Ancylobacter lacus TaxID=2579970 RepID=UPI001BCFBB6F|nr:hypothetical protein [Ancylobacter lacus]MBS7539749.1 hypothetical protein [Ancylobacter lacus]
MPFWIAFPLAIGLLPPVVGAVAGGISYAVLDLTGDRSNAGERAWETGIIFALMVFIALVGLGLLLRVEA